MRLATTSLFAALMAVSLAGPAAVNPEEMLKGQPQLEERARDIGKDLRCLVCQNQSIDDSDAELARDLRVIVRERLLKGDSDDQVRQFVVDRYGDYVLLRPPVKPETYALWFGPLGLLALALLGASLFYRRRATEAAPPVRLSAEEARRLETLLGKDRP